jgi:signal transduction histidine kinase
VKRMAVARQSRMRPRRERRRSRAERVARKVPPGRVFAGIHEPLVRALDLLGPQAKQISTAWRKLLRRLAPDRKEFEGLEALASLDLGEHSSHLRSADYDSYFEAVRLQGQALSVQGVPEDQAVAALAFYLESALSRLLDQTSEKDLALALVRLTSAIQRFVMSGYNLSRARGWRRLDEQERLKLSRDLHDDIGADLVVLKLYIEMIGLELKRGRVEQIGPKLEEALALVGHAVESVRRLTLDLGPAILDQIGLAAAIKLYCRQFSSRTGISVQVHEAQLPERAPASHETALYRVLQGALSNVVKHARARNVKVHLGALRSKVIVMIIEDDGVGFDTVRHPPQGAFGLTAMRDRIESLGGRIHVESRPGRKAGARIEIDLPLREEAP